MSLIFPTRTKTNFKLVIPTRGVKVEKPKFEFTTPADARTLEAKDLMNEMIKSGQVNTSTPIIIPPRKELNLLSKVADYIEPKPKVRAIDFVREIPGALATVGNFIRTVQQEISRSGASVALTMTGAPSGGAKELDISGKNIENKVARVIFGDRPLQSIETRIANAELAVKDWGQKLEKSNKEWKKSIGKFSEENALGLSIIGVGGTIALDFTGAGGQKSAIKALAQSKDIGFISKLLRQIGVAEDLIPSVSTKISTIKDEKVILNAINKISEIQKSTKIIKEGIAEAGQTKLSLPTKPLAQEARDTLAKMTGGKDKLKLIDEIVNRKWDKVIEKAPGHYELYQGKKFGIEGVDYNRLDIPTNPKDHPAFLKALSETTGIDFTSSKTSKNVADKLQKFLDNKAAQSKAVGEVGKFKVGDNVSFESPTYKGRFSDGKFVKDNGDGTSMIKVKTQGFADWERKVKNEKIKAVGEVKPTLDEIFAKPAKIKTLTGKEQLEFREAQKLAREDEKLKREARHFYGELENQYQNFKKLITPAKLENIEDAAQLKNKIKADPAKIDNILYSQEKNESEVFDIFKERRLAENVALPQVPKETKAVVAEKARQTVMSAKEKVERRREFVKIAQRQFELSDNDVRRISQKDVRNMGDYEYKKFLDDFRIKAMELADTREVKNRVLGLVRDKELQRVDALRNAMKLPPIEKMNIDDLGKLEVELEKAQFGDVFLTQRELETVAKTDLGNIKTIREAREKLAQELKIPVSQLENIKVAELDRLRFDTALAEKNPFYKMMVENTHAQLLKAEENFLGEEKIINDLVIKARKSVKRGLIEKAIPTDNLVFDYLSGQTKLAEQMTKEELELANYLQIKYADALEYLIENKVLTKGRSNYITNTRRGFLEAIKDSGLKKAFTELFDSYKQDEEIFQILDQSTKEILPLEKFFQFSLKRTGGIKPTKNIAKATETYFKVLEKKKALDALIPKIDIYVQSLTPQRLTPKGLEMDRRLKTFVNEWLNNKKGRRTTLIAKQGGKIDIATNAIRSFLYFKDLALSLPVGIASLVGEQVSTFVNIGNRLYLKGVSRYASKQGLKIIDSYKNFIGKNIWEELAEPSKNIGDKFTEGMFGLFKQSTAEANKIHLLGNLTDIEFSTGKISTERLAQMKLEIGRFRMLGEGKSIIGSTPEGQILTQYKTWAIPIFRTISKDLITISKNLLKGEFKKTLTSRELKEILRAAEVTTAVIFLGNKFLDEEDNSFLGKLTKRLYMEAMTILGALDTKTMLAAPRLVSFVENLGKAVSSIIKLEEYKTKKGYVGVEQLKKELRPGFIRQFETKETAAPRIKELDKIFNRGTDKRQSLEQIFQ